MSSRSYFKSCSWSLFWYFWYNMVLFHKCMMPFTATHIFISSACQPWTDKERKDLRDFFSSKWDKCPTKLEIENFKRVTGNTREWLKSNTMSGIYRKKVRHQKLTAIPSMFWHLAVEQPCCVICGIYNLQFCSLITLLLVLDHMYLTQNWFLW